MIGGLHVQVAYLTQRGQIPPFAIVLVAVQVMNRQHSLFAVSLVLAALIALRRFAGPLLPMTAAHAAPADTLFHRIGNLPPIIRIINYFHVSNGLR